MPIRSALGRLRRCSVRQVLRHFAPKARQRAQRSGLAPPEASLHLSKPKKSGRLGPLLQLQPKLLLNIETSEFSFRENEMNETKLDFS
jgi:hypothetical protein